jgi:preprotein translocase subunit Sec61beta
MESKRISIKPIAITLVAIAVLAIVAVAFVLSGAFGQKDPGKSDE